MGRKHSEDSEPSGGSDTSSRKSMLPSFLKALLDEVNVEILRVTSEDFLTVSEIAEAIGIRRQACYRRVRALLKEGLLCPKPEDPESRGRPSNRYRSTLGDVYVVLSGDLMTVRLVWPTDSVDFSITVP